MLPTAGDRELLQLYLTRLRDLVRALKLSDWLKQPPTIVLLAYLFARAVTCSSAVDVLAERPPGAASFRGWLRARARRIFLGGEQMQQQALDVGGGGPHHAAPDELMYDAAAIVGLGTPPANAGDEDVETVHDFYPPGSDLDPVPTCVAILSFSEMFRFGGSYDDWESAMWRAARGNARTAGNRMRDLQMSALRICIRQTQSTTTLQKMENKKVERFQNFYHTPVRRSSVPSSSTGAPSSSDAKMNAGRNKDAHWLNINATCSSPTSPSAEDENKAKFVVELPQDGCEDLIRAFLGPALPGAGLCAALHPALHPESLRPGSTTAQLLDHNYCGHNYFATEASAIARRVHRQREDAVVSYILMKVRQEAEKGRTSLEITRKMITHEILPVFHSDDGGRRLHTSGASSDETKSSSSKSREEQGNMRTGVLLLDLADVSSCTAADTGNDGNSTTAALDAHQPLDDIFAQMETQTSNPTAPVTATAAPRPLADVGGTATRTQAATTTTAEALRALGKNHPNDYSWLALRLVMHGFHLSKEPPAGYSFMSTTCELPMTISWLRFLVGGSAGTGFSSPLLHTVARAESGSSRKKKKPHGHAHLLEHQTHGTAVAVVSSDSDDSSQDEQETAAKTTGNHASAVGGAGSTLSAASATASLSSDYTYPFYPTSRTTANSSSSSPKIKQKPASSCPADALLRQNRVAAARKQRRAEKKLHKLQTLLTEPLEYDEIEKHYQHQALSRACETEIVFRYYLRFYLSQVEKIMLD
eukprot:g2667.t1